MLVTGFRVTLLSTHPTPYHQCGLHVSITWSVVLQCMKVIMNFHHLWYDTYGAARNLPLAKLRPHSLIQLAKGYRVEQAMGGA